MDLYNRLNNQYFEEDRRCRSTYFEKFFKKYENIQDDDTDVIDLRTMKIIKDNGHLKYMAVKTFGSSSKYECKSRTSILIKLKREVKILYESGNTENDSEANEEYCFEQSVMQLQSLSALKEQLFKTYNAGRSVKSCKKNITDIQKPSLSKKFHNATIDDLTNPHIFTKQNILSDTEAKIRKKYNIKECSVKVEKLNSEQKLMSANKVSLVKKKVLPSFEKVKNTEASQSKNQLIQPCISQCKIPRIANSNECNNLNNKNKQNTKGILKSKEKISSKNVQISKNEFNIYKYSSEKLIRNSSFCLYVSAVFPKPKFMEDSSNAWKDSFFKFKGKNTVAEQKNKYVNKEKALLSIQYNDNYTFKTIPSCLAVKSVKEKANYKLNKTFHSLS